jgi:hypothetical protein
MNPQLVPGKMLGVLFPRLSLTSAAKAEFKRPQLPQRWKRCATQKQNMFWRFPIWHPALHPSRRCGFESRRFQLPFLKEKIR